MRRFVLVLLLILAGIGLLVQPALTPFTSPALASDSTDVECWSVPVPVVPTTWGRIKQFYGDGPAAARVRVNTFTPRTPGAEILGTFCAYSDNHSDAGPDGPANAMIARRVFAAIAACDPNIVVAGGDHTEFDRKAEYDSLKVQLEEAGLTDKIRPAPGNHDGLSDIVFGSFVNYNAWANTSAYADDSFGDSYCFDVPEWGMRFISMRSGGTARVATLAWAEEKIRTRPTGWMVVPFQHHSPFAVGQKGGQETSYQYDLVPLCRRYKVPLLIAGHDHDFFAVQFGTGETLYVVIGTAGHKLTQLKSNPWINASVNQVEFRHGFLRCDVSEGGIRVRFNTVESSAGPGGLTLFDHFIERDPCLDPSKL